MTRVLLTTDGEIRLQNELQQLKRVDRPNIISAIAEARAHGDLSENAEYHAAKEQQGFIEGRIAELESKLASAEVVDPSKLNFQGKVVFGTLVDLWEEAGDREADIDQGMISHNSPIAKAIIGKSAGDEIEFTAPDGARRYEILAVRTTPADTGSPNN